MKKTLFAFIIATTTASAEWVDNCPESYDGLIAWPVAARGCECGQLFKLTREQHDFIYTMDDAVFNIWSESVAEIIDEKC